MNTLSEEEESNLIDDVKRAVDLADDGGMSPDAAVEKIARERGYGPGSIRLLAYGYNTGRQTAQREAGESVLDKLAAFPLVDPEAVVASIHGGDGEKRASSVDPEYAEDPCWLESSRGAASRRALVKEARDASAAGPPPAPAPGRMAQLDRAVSDLRRRKMAIDELARVGAEAEDQLRMKLASIVDHFRRGGPAARGDFAVVEGAAAAYFGKEAASVLDYVAASLPYPVDRAAAGSVPVVKRAIDLDAHPYPAIREAIALAGACVAASAGLEDARAKHAADSEGRIRPFCRAGRAPALPDRGTLELPGEEKYAGIFSAPAVGAAVGSILSRGLGGMPKTKDDLIQDAWLDLEDPDHQNELRKIRAHAMLNGFMTDPDDPISGHDPDKVLRAYNEISQLAPRSSEQPAIMGPLLRRRLGGNMEPFESREIADTEKSLSQTGQLTPQSRQMSNAPDAILG